MNASTLKSWKMDQGVLTSPRFKDERAFERCRKFLIRSFLHGEYDDRSLVITIDTKGSQGRGNLERLKKMEIIGV